MLANSALEPILLLIAPLATLVFALGEQFGWWDRLTGRSKALEGLERLYSAEGYPKTHIQRDEDRAIFHALERRISPRTSDELMKKRMAEGIVPNAITVVGRPFEVTGLEPRMKSFVYADIHPVVYLYSFEDQNRKHEKVAQVTTLGELTKWLDNEKTDRRFWVVSLIVGILSIVMLFLTSTTGSS